MAAVTPAPPESHGPKVFTNDPVLISWVVFTFVQAVVAVLLLASVIEEVVGGIIVGVIAAAYAAVSQLFVRPATVPREPLAELAAANGTGP
jgi:membrane protein YdbS with pleckstrin-like domain